MFRLQAVHKLAGEEQSRMPGTLAGEIFAVIGHKDITQDKLIKLKRQESYFLTHVSCSNQGIPGCQSQLSGRLHALGAQHHRMSCDVRYVLK